MSVAHRLKKLGLRVWVGNWGRVPDFLSPPWINASLPPQVDDFEMTGDIVAAMCRAVEQSACVAVFVTERYVRKVGCEDDDNCKRGFSYAVQHKSTNNIVGVWGEENA